MMHATPRSSQLRKLASLGQLSANSSMQQSWKSQTPKAKRCNSHRNPQTPQKQKEWKRLPTFIPPARPQLAPNTRILLRHQPLHQALHAGESEKRIGTLA